MCRYLNPTIDVVFTLLLGSPETKDCLIALLKDLSLHLIGLDHGNGQFDYLCIRSRHSREGGNPVNSATSATSGPPPSRG